MTVHKVLNERQTSRETVRLQIKVSLRDQLWVLCRFYDHVSFLQTDKVSHPLLVSVQYDQVRLVSVAPVSGLVPGQRCPAEKIATGAKKIPVQRTTAVPHRP